MHVSLKAITLGISWLEFITKLQNFAWMQTSCCIVYCITVTSFPGHSKRQPFTNAILGNFSHSIFCNFNQLIYNYWPLVNLVCLYDQTFLKVKSQQVTTILFLRFIILVMWRFEPSQLLRIISGMSFIMLFFLFENKHNSNLTCRFRRMLCFKQKSEVFVCSEKYQC